MYGFRTLVRRAQMLLDRRGPESICTLKQPFQALFAAKYLMTTTRKNGTLTPTDTIGTVVPDSFKSVFQPIPLKCVGIFPNYAGKLLHCGNRKRVQKGRGFKKSRFEFCRHACA